MAPHCEWYRLSQAKVAKKISKNPLPWCSRSSKVIEFSANQKPVYDFLLVINSNLGFISHRYWDTASYRSKIANFDHPPLISHPRSGWPPSNFWKSFTVPETRVFQAADGEDLVILACIVFAWSTRVTDRQTDGRTELRWLRRAESIAAFARKHGI